MTNIIVSTRTRMDVVVSGTLNGAENRLVPYSRQGVYYQPMRFTIEYSCVWDYSGIAGPWVVEAVKLDGLKIKKDSSLGVQRADETFYGLRDLPEFVIQIIEQHTPEIAS
jgi:hypothetical protein